MSLQWHYLDSQGHEFGPFDGEKMRRWFDQNYFQVAGENLLVRLPDWRAHRRLSEAYAGDRAAYFVTPPRHGDAAAPARDRSRSPRGYPGYGEGYYPRGAPPPAAGYPPQASGAPSPYGGAPHWQPNGYPPPPAWGHLPPPGPWGHPPAHFAGAAPPHAPYGWGPPPAGMGHPPGHYPYWDPRVQPHPHGPPGPYGPPPVGDYWRPPAIRDDDRSEDERDRARRSGGSKQQQASAAEAAARVAEEQAEELRRLGRDGLRELLTTTLESLYKDRIKPLANYVKGRLKERSSPEAAVKTFVELYGQHADLFRVQKAAAGDEATIFFATEPAWFKGWVDIDSSEDPYDEVLWREMKGFLDGGHTFAGGRYGMARELTQRNLPFLAPYSLGEICHIVQLAIQQRKIIVYHKKMLKPMQPALCQAVPTTNGTGGAPADLEEIADLFQLCRVLFKALKSNPQGIRLDRMKQVIKEACACRLNEMAFQCTKLIELFRQEPLRSTFTLENDGKAIYVRAGDPKLFPERVRGIHAEVAAADSRPR